MKIRYQDTDYEPVAIDDATLLDTLDLRKQAGITIADAADGWEILQGLEEQAEVKGADQEALAREIFTDDRAIQALITVVWLAVRHGGQPRLAWNDVAGNLSLKSLEDLWIIEPGDEVEAKVADPTKPSQPRKGGAAAGANRAPRRAATKSSTARKRTPSNA